MVAERLDHAGPVRRQAGGAALEGLAQFVQ
jgi:hypothetical protein